MNHLSVIKDEKCFGCMKCQALCPQNAIFIERNEEGFDFPRIEQSKCVNCGLCRKECIANIEKTEIFNYEYAYVAQAGNEIRKFSSSGGFFTVVATMFLKNNGVVCGAAFVGNKVKHIIVDDIEEIDKLRRSKYVQSDMSDVYHKIINYLNQGVNVLFVGTPCQCEAISSFCGDNSKKLYTLEILCMGVPSPGIFEQYLNDDIGVDAEDINFRDKSINGWSTELMMSYEKQGEKKYILAENSSYFKMFLEGYALRQSCYDCKYVGLKRTSDISMGDFWGIGDYNELYDDKNGTSLILISTEKGEDIFKQIRDELILCEKISIDIALKCNPILLYSSEDRGCRKKFFENIKSKSLSESVERMSNYKIDCGIINFWWADDNGGILTAYALQNTLTKLGFSSELIDLKTDIKTGGISELFARKHLNVTQRVTCYDDYMRLNNIFSTFIVGSDQVFRTEWVPDTWFLEFVDFFKKKIAVAASFGKDYIDVDEKRRKKIAYLLSRFNHISVREKQGISICRTLGCKAVHIIDPVFYIEPEEYIERLGLTVNDDEHFIFVYFRDMTDSKKKLYKDIAKFGKYSIFIANDETEVEVFVEKLMNCAWVITDSYHAICFSLIFNKKYICVLNKLRGVERFNSIIEMFDLDTKMFINEENIAYIDVNNFIYDWKKVNFIIKNEVDRAILWINNALKDSKKNDLSRCFVKKIQYMLYSAKEEISNSIRNRMEYFKLRVRKNEIYDYIVCFGAGQYGLDFIDQFDGRILFFIDNSRKKKWVKSIPVFQLNDAMKIMDKECEIVITTSLKYQNEIKEQLCGCGFKNVKISGEVL